MGAVEPYEYCAAIPYLATRGRWGAIPALPTRGRCRALWALCSNSFSAHQGALLSHSPYIPQVVPWRTSRCAHQGAL